MDRKVRVVQYGAGKMSRYLMRYVLEHGGELVGAFCRNKSHIGKDVSEIIGNGYPTVGVLVEDSATVKEFYKENGHYRLQPRNPAMEPILVEEVSILGKVISSVRYY